MKKKIAVLLVIFLMFSVIITSCSDKEDIETDNNQTNNTEKKTITSEEPPPYMSTHYGSFDELKYALTEKDSREYYAIRYGSEEYKDFINAFENGDEKFIFPQINGQNISFSDRWKNCVMGVYEWCFFEGYPEVMYLLKVKEKDLYFRVTYVNIYENEKIDSAKTALEVISIIKPKAPTPSNYNSDSYKRVYEKEIQIANGTNITALIREKKYPCQDWVYLYIENVLIVMYTDTDGEEIFTDEFWKSFSIDYIDVI